VSGGNGHLEEETEKRNCCLEKETDKQRQMIPLKFLDPYRWIDFYAVPKGICGEIYCQHEKCNGQLIIQTQWYKHTRIHNLEEYIKTFVKGTNFTKIATDSIQAAQSKTIPPVLTQSPQVQVKFPNPPPKSNVAASVNNGQLFNPNAKNNVAVSVNQDKRKPTNQVQNPHPKSNVAASVNGQAKRNTVFNPYAKNNEDASANGEKRKPTNQTYVDVSHRDNKKAKIQCPSCPCCKDNKKCAVIDFLEKSTTCHLCNKYCPGTCGLGSNYCLKCFDSGPYVSHGYSECKVAFEGNKKDKWLCVFCYGLLGMNGRHGKSVCRHKERIKRLLFDKLADADNDEKKSRVQKIDERISRLNREEWFKTMHSIVDERWVPSWLHWHFAD